MVGVLARLLADGFCVPEHKRIDPLVAVPTGILPFVQELPLPTAWDLAFEADDARQD